MLRAQYRELHCAQPAHVAAAVAQKRLLGPTLGVSASAQPLQLINVLGTLLLWWARADQRLQKGVNAYLSSRPSEH